MTRAEQSLKADKSPQPDTATEMGSAMAEIWRRLKWEEKREFVRLVDWGELERARQESSQSQHWDPRIYVGTTPAGLSFELLSEHVIDFVCTLSNVLSPREINAFVQDDEGYREYDRLDSIKTFLQEHRDTLHKDYVMIEFDDSTLVSAGDGCLSLALEGSHRQAVRIIATRFLKVCGYEHEFRQEHFSVVMWKDTLEVKEW